MSSLILEPRVWYHDKQWRLRFVVAPTEQLCVELLGGAEAQIHTFGQSPLPN